MKKFTKCPICGASIKIENMSEHIRRAHTESLDSGESKRRPLMTRAAMDMDACDELYDKAARFVERKKFKKAIKTLQKIPEEYPDIADVYSLIAISYTGLGRFDDAPIYHEKAANAAPWEWYHWYNLASVHLRNADILKARRCLDKVNEIGFPSDMGDMVDKLSKNIAELLEIVLSEKPYLDAETYIILEDRFHSGVECMKKRDWDRAIEDFKYILSIDERSEKTYGNLGLTYLLKGEFDEAEMCFNKALEINPEYLPATMNADMLDEVREKVAKDPGYLEKLNDHVIKRHF